MELALLLKSHQFLGIKKHEFMALARLAFAYGSESWTRKRTDERRLTSTEMRLMGGGGAFRTQKEIKL
jgi:hypothetical protein